MSGRRFGLELFQAREIAPRILGSRKRRSHTMDSAEAAATSRARKSEPLLTNGAGFSGSLVLGSPCRPHFEYFLSFGIGATVLASEGYAISHPAWSGHRKSEKQPTWANPGFSLFLRLLSFGLAK